MDIEKLKAKLDSITGNSPIDEARRSAILAMIIELMNEQEN